MNPEDVPDVPAFPKREESGWFDKIPADLGPVVRKFTLAFLDDTIRKNGVDMVVRAMRVIEDRIARGSLRGMGKGMAWKVMLGTIKSLKEDDDVTKSMSVKRRALPILFETGDPYLVAGVKYQKTAEGWFVGGLKWHAEPERLMLKLEHDAKRCGWRFSPQSASAERRLRDFPMFKEGP